MQRARERFARFTLLLGVVAWVAGWSASLVHRSITLHASCEVHGDQVDVGNVSADAHADHDKGPVASSLDAVGEHGHDCAFQALGVARIPVALDPVVVVERFVREDDPVPTLRAPRGPPLSYAPKTSPPRMG